MTNFFIIATTEKGELLTIGAVDAAKYGEPDLPDRIAFCVEAVNKARKAKIEEIERHRDAMNRL